MKGGRVAGADNSPDYHLSTYRLLFLKEINHEKVSINYGKLYCFTHAGDGGL